MNNIVDQVKTQIEESLKSFSYIASFAPYRNNTKDNAIYIQFFVGEERVKDDKTYVIFNDTKIIHIALGDQFDVDIIFADFSLWCHKKSFPTLHLNDIALLDSQKNISLIIRNDPSLNISRLPTKSQNQ